MLHAHKQALERDLEDEKQRLAQLREARNSANHESLALRRDRKHLIAELRFLRHMAEEEEGLILVLQNSNQYLETSRGTLEASSATLAKVSAESQCKSFDWLTPNNSMSNSSGAFVLRGNLGASLFPTFLFRFLDPFQVAQRSQKMKMVDGEYYSIGMGLCGENSHSQQTITAIGSTAHDYYQL